MKKQTNRQTVCFNSNGRWFKNCIDLKNVYTSVHSNKAGYGSSANVLINEMMANLLDLARQNKIDLTKPFVITDFGCGQSKASNVLAQVVSANSAEIDTMLREGKSYGDILAYLAPIIKAADKAQNSMPQQVMHYKHITVQRFDIGIPEFSTPLKTKADLVFCNDVLEHIPGIDMPAFIADLEAAGNFVIASISLRDAVNYNKIEKATLLAGAKPVDKPEGMVLTQDESGDYIFSLHVSIMPQEKWQEVLGSNWHLLPAQDYTACSAMNFEPSEEYQHYKRVLISQIGFADFIPFPVKLNSRYEQDPILFRRTAKMQAQKHLCKLNALEGYPDSEFSRRERSESFAFLQFIGADIAKGKTGKWELTCELPEYYLSKLDALEHLSKQGENLTQEMVKTKAAAIIKEYNDGKTAIVDDYINNL